MEKRTVLAFVLSALVLFVWQTYFGVGDKTQPQTPTQTQQAPSSPVVSGGAAIPAPQPIQAGALVPDPAKKHKHWTIDSQLYTMRIGESGGRIEGFELKKYPQSTEPGAPPTEIITTRESGYLPLQVDFLRHPDWPLSTMDFSSAAPAEVSIDSGTPAQPIAFRAEIPNQLRLTKMFSIEPDSYCVDVEIKMENLGSAPLSDQLGISFFYEPYVSAVSSSYNQSYLGAFQKGILEKFQPKDLLKKNPVFTPALSWTGYYNNYFLNAFAPLDETGYQVLNKVLDLNKGLVQTDYQTDPFEIAPGQSKTVGMKLYLGPKELARLEQAGRDLPKSIDYGWFGVLARPLVQMLKWLYGYTHNYGVAIIILTVLIKIVFWPLTHKSYKSMQVMKKLQPKINQVREKYKDDREKLNQELMMLYRTYKVNPMGGCLPMVLQIPVFFALYRMLSNSVELFHQPFALWVHDLTAPDRLYIGFTIPTLGGLPVLTILMGLSMFLQQKMTPSSGDPRQEKMMMLMPVMFTFFFINVPSGLVLYWLVNNILSIAQQYWINRNV